MKSVKIEQIFISTLLHFEWFTKSIDSNQFLETLLLEAFVTIFVQECYSYEVDVENLNWLLFNVAASWLEIWNEIVRVQYNHYFSNWFMFLKRLWFSFISWILLFNHLKLFATMFDNIVNRVRRKKFVATMLFAHCLLIMRTFIMRIWSKTISCLNCCFFHDQLLQSQHLFFQSIWIFCMISDTILLITFATSTIIETSSMQKFWLVSVSRIEREFSIIWVLNCIALVRLRNRHRNFCSNRRSILLKSSCDFLTRSFCYAVVEIIVLSTIDDAVHILVLDTLQNETKRSKSLFSRCFSMTWV